MILSNFHTHSVFCDGKDTCEEMVLKAISLGFKKLGFSGHVYTSFDTSFCMSKENSEKYIETVNFLKEKYSGKIEILCGIEFDIFSDTDVSPYDFVIGSVHYVKGKKELRSVDLGPDETRDIINTDFDGNSMNFVKSYYELVSHINDYVKCDIVGHFDLITKFSEKFPDLIDYKSDEYKTCALDAFHELSKTNNLFEINTGAISRGWRTTCYPDVFLLKEMQKSGCDIIVNSDCHDKNYLDCNFKESEELLKECGFKYRTELSENGLIHIKL